MSARKVVEMLLRVLSVLGSGLFLPSSFFSLGSPCLRFRVVGLVIYMVGIGFCRPPLCMLRVFARRAAFSLMCGLVCHVSCARWSFCARFLF